MLFPSPTTTTSPSACYLVAIASSVRIAGSLSQGQALSTGQHIAFTNAILAAVPQELLDDVCGGPASLKTS